MNFFETSISRARYGQCAGIEQAGLVGLATAVVDRARHVKTRPTDGTIANEHVGGVIRRLILLEIATVAFANRRVDLFVLKAFAFVLASGFLLTQHNTTKSV